jgi:DNA-binding MarR family transcriptional regulator
MQQVALDIAGDIAGTVQRLFGAMRRLSPPGLSLTAASTLSTLEREGPHRLTELAVKEGVTQPAMTQLVTRLENDALAQRRADPQDRRVVLVEITAAGRDLLRHRRSVRVARVEAMLQALPAADRRAVEAALPALNRLADLIADRITGQ